MIAYDVLKKLDNMLEASYGQSFFKKYIARKLRSLFIGRISYLFVSSVTAGAISGFIAILSRAMRPILQFFLNIYRGSAFLNTIGLALENSRWIK